MRSVLEGENFFARHGVSLSQNEEKRLPLPMIAGADTSVLETLHQHQMLVSAVEGAP